MFSAAQFHINDGYLQVCAFPSWLQVDLAAQELLWDVCQCPLIFLCGLYLSILSFPNPLTVHPLFITKKASKIYSFWNKPHLHYLSPLFFIIFSAPWQPNILQRVRKQKGHTIPIKYTWVDCNFFIGQPCLWHFLLHPVECFAT